MQSLIDAAGDVRFPVVEKKLLRKSAIVLAGGSSSRFGEDKGVIELAGKPLLRRVVDSLRHVVDEIVVVTSSHERATLYSKIVGSGVKFSVDERESQGPLIGALTGFRVATGEYALLVPFDTPFVSSKVVILLFEMCIGKAAAIPRWPSGQIEPLHAVYCTRMALEAAGSAVDSGRLDMRGMIERMHSVRFVSTLVIEQLDPEFKTFFNINTPLDLKKAMAIAKKENIS